jgi:hypothetical protein
MDGGGPGPQLELKVERNPSHNVVTCVTVRRGGYFPAIKAFRLSLSYFFEKPELGSAVSGQCVSSSRSLSVRWLSGAYYLKVAAAVLSRPYTTSQALWEFTRRIHSRQSLSCAPPGPPPPFPTPPPPAPLPTHGPALCSLRSWASRAAERISIPRGQGHSIARH